MAGEEHRTVAASPQAPKWHVRSPRASRKVASRVQGGKVETKRQTRVVRHTKTTTGLGSDSESRTAKDPSLLEYNYSVANRQR